MTRIRGVLRGSTDSSIAEAQIQGDSAILEFQKVVVQGDSSPYTLRVQATDANNVLVFTGTQALQIKPGDNSPASPSLDYAAPDSSAATVDVSVTALLLEWAGAAVGNTTCLNKIPNAASVTQQKLSVTGTTSTGANVPAVRVGWTSRDTTVFTVDTAGLVKARCSNKSAWLVVRTFLNKADSILVTVTAPAFSLVMSPDSTSIPRGSTAQLTALVVDENSNTVPAASVNWFSSDTTRAKVNATGLVTGLANGRVLITAGSGNRTTVGVVRVVRPLAAKVVMQPAVALEDSLGRGQYRAYFAKALDAANRVIPEATGFVWSSSATSVATINPATGVAVAVDTGRAFMRVTLPPENKRDSIPLKVLTSMPPGSIKGKITNATDGLPLAGVDVRSSASNAATTAADGSFTLGGLQYGDEVVLSMTGFVPAVAYNVPAFPGKVIEVPSVPLSPSGGGNSAISGKVVNALTGSAVSGFSVKAYKGINSGPSPKRPNVTPDFSATTDANGVFTISNAPAGNYTLLYSATGYSDNFGGANSVSTIPVKTIADVLVAPNSGAGGIYIVLTWGDCSVPANNVPCDLDAHLTGPKFAPDTVPPRFQVFQGSPRYVIGADTIAALDVGDSNGRGPEIIGLRPSAPAPTSVAQRYRFYVHNATAGTTPNMALADSASARVDVYQDNQLIGTFFPPAGVSGTVWNVFDYDGARLIPVGTITTEATPGVLAQRASELRVGRP
ncbi:MAG: Ig-like domain-containing protein [Gemmatimonadota bacterium]